MEEKTIKWTEPYYPTFEEVKREMIKDMRSAVLGLLKFIGVSATVLGMLALHVWFFASYLGLGEDNGVPLGLVTAFGMWIGIPGSLWIWYGSVVDRIRSEKYVAVLRKGHDAGV